MDTNKALTQQEAIDIAREYKRVIMPRFGGKAKVFLYGSYSKGTARPESDIDLAVIVPHCGENWLAESKALWRDVDKVSLLIEPVLIAEEDSSPLYADVMHTGIQI